MPYTVGEMAKLLGVPASTLRYYDREGLLPFVERSPGGIRLFTDRDYGQLKVIGCLKQSGLSIREIREYLALAAEGDASLDARLALFQSRRAAVEGQLEDLRQTLEVLEYKCWYYETARRAGTEDAARDLPAEAVPPAHQAARARLRLKRRTPPGPG